jgi:hypothetical protein
MQKRKQLGEMLVEEGLIDRLQLRAAISQHESWGKPLGRTLIEMRLVSEENMIRVLGAQLNLPTVNLAHVELDPSALALVDEEFCRKHECIPFAYQEQGKFLDVAMADVQDPSVHDALRVSTRCNIRPYVSGVDAVKDALERVYGPRLADLELQFQLSENLFDFGEEAEPQAGDLRHVDPAVRRPSDEYEPVLELSSEPSAPCSPPAPPSRADEDASSMRRPVPRVIEDTSSILRPVEEPEPLDALAPGAESDPLGAFVADPRQRALEQRVVATQAKVARLEKVLQQIVLQLREVVGQLAQTHLVELAPNHPLLPQLRPRGRAVPNPETVPPLDTLAARVPEPRPAPQAPARPATPVRGVPIERVPTGTRPQTPVRGVPIERVPTGTRPQTPVRGVPIERVPTGARPQTPPRGAAIEERRPSSLGEAAAEPPRTPSSRGLQIVERRRTTAVDARVVERPPDPRSEGVPPRRTPAAASAQVPPRSTSASGVRMIEDAATSRLVSAPRRPGAGEVRPSKAPSAGPSLPLLELPETARSVVAIDFGTTRSSVASLIDRRISVLKLPGGEWDVPTVVGFRSDGSVVLGKAARNMLAIDAENAIASPKRLLGRRYDDPALGPYLAQLGMKSFAGPKGDILLNARGRRVTVVEACSHMLKLLKLVAERNLGEGVRDVILTVPVTAGERQLRELASAAEYAELTVREFVHEPVAAAMACVFDPECEGQVAIYDFGGGTFDFSVVQVGAGSMEVTASAGDGWLGGDDLDIALASAAANALWQQAKVEVRNQAHLWQHLLVRAEAAKRELSERDETVLVLPNAIRTGGGEQSFEFPITRAKFAKLIGGIIDRSLDSCREALSSKRIDPRSLSAIYLSGGTSYVPAIQQAVAEFFGKMPRTLMPPERMVVVGAAVHGALSG